MKKDLRVFFTRQLLLALALVVSLTAPGQASILPNASTVGGAITQDTVWNLAGSPYEATSIVTVAANVTLTIEPGVIVRFNPNTRLNVNGTLHALGAAGSEITFTGTTPTPGSWNGIWIVTVSNTRSVDNRLEHVLIEYGGGGIANSANLYVSNADVSVRHAEMRNGSGNGLTSWGIPQPTYRIPDLPAMPTRQPILYWRPSTPPCGIWQPAVTVVTQLGSAAPACP